MVKLRKWAVGFESEDIAGQAIEIERKRTELRLSRLAHYDPLTGLANRAFFTDDLNRALARAKRHNGVLGLLFIDLDRFKNINDTLGHDAGDDLLREVADRIKHCVREGDATARLGGDEFTVTLEGIEAVSSAEVVAAKILRTIAAPFTLHGHEVMISPSIGIATYPAAGEDAGTLLKNADIAMYRAKEQGRNNYQIFSNTMNAEGLFRLDMERDLRHALGRRELLLHYQPVIEIASGRVCAVEALLRWQRSGYDRVIPPLEFIPVLEDTGLINAVGEWVLKSAFTQCRVWQETGAPDLRIAVNVSPKQLRGPDSLRWITRALEESGLSAHSLDLEITEATLMDQSDTGYATLKQLQDMGIGVSIDDFGTGYSSLSYLLNFSLNTVKIDRSFLRDVTTNPATAVIVAAVIQMAHGLGLRVIAEGVEDDAQLDFLRAKGCDEYQGYLFSAPIPVEAVPDTINRSTAPK